MTKTITIGKKLIPLEHVVLAVPFDPETQLNIQTERSLKTCLILIDRDSVLTEQALAEFVEEHGFRMLQSDGVGTNPLVRVSVEAFAPSPDFQPRRPYRSRLVWRDLDGERNSVLLLSDPADVLAIAVRGTLASPSEPEAAAKETKPRRKRPSPPSPS